MSKIGALRELLLGLLQEHEQDGAIPTFYELVQRGSSARNVQVPAALTRICKTPSPICVKAGKCPGIGLPTKPAPSMTIPAIPQSKTEHWPF